ncbi:MAG: hypothetical protein GXO79_01705 [Chlorobi bacterium]|nr:hypothetical protein [Chlorobiota bacterium]
MKKIIWITLLLVSIISCKKNKDLENIDFRKEMVQFVSEISEYAKAKNNNFLIIPQNGESLADDPEYLLKVNGIGREDLNYGYNADGELTPDADKAEMIKYLDKFTGSFKKVFVTDYVFSNSEDIPQYDESTLGKIDNAYSNSIAKGYVPYATVRNLNFLTINQGHEPEEKTILRFDDVQSFLYYIQTDNVSRDEYINSISQTNFDLVIMDLTFDGINEFTAEEISKIKTGLNKGKGGYVICYMSIGEAEDYRYYWKDEWLKSNGEISNDAPEWLYAENPDWEGNYDVLYWNSNWKNIIYGNSAAYLDKIIAKGFDGVYLDIVDGYEYYEDVMGQ